MKSISSRSLTASIWIHVPCFRSQGPSVFILDLFTYWSQMLMCFSGWILLTSIEIPDDWLCPSTWWFSCNPVEYLWGRCYHCLLSLLFIYVFITNICSEAPFSNPHTTLPRSTFIWEVFTFVIMDSWASKIIRICWHGSRQLYSVFYDL